MSYKRLSETWIPWNWTVRIDGPTLISERGVEAHIVGEEVILIGYAGRGINPGVGRYEDFFPDENKNRFFERNSKVRGVETWIGDK